MAAHRGTSMAVLIREALEQKQLEEARQFVPIVAAAIDRLRGDVDRAASLVGRLPRK